MSTESIRRRILAGRGIKTAPPRKPKLPVTEKDHLKTPMMRLVELQTGRLVEDLLTEKSLKQLEKDLRIDYSTISKWIKKLNLRWTMDNLPGCEGCGRKNLTCQVSGTCTRLLDQHAGDMLVEAKRLEMMQGGLR